MSTIQIYNCRCQAYIFPVPSHREYKRPNWIPPEAELVHSYEVSGLYFRVLTEYLRRLNKQKGSKEIWNLILDLPFVNKYLIREAYQK